MRFHLRTFQGDTELFFAPHSILIGGADVSAAVNLSGIKVGALKLQGALDDGINLFLGLRLSIEGRKSHASKSNRGRFKFSAHLGE